jgi:hypothetical protein
MPPGRHEARIDHDNVAKEADVHGVALSPGLVAPGPVEGNAPTLPPPGLPEV